MSVRLDVGVDLPCPPDGGPGGEFDAVFARNWDRLFRFASLMVGDRGDGEDIVQEAFSRWYVRRGSIVNADAYLRTTVANLARSRLRRREVVRRRAHLFETEVSRRNDVGHDALGDVIAGLPARQRAAVILRFYVGLSEAEIAETLGCRPGTVKSLLSRALTAMRLVVER